MKIRYGNCWVLSVSLFFIPSFLHAGFSPRPESARPYGMGNAFSALANDYNAMLFNPAGLGSLQQMEAAVHLNRAFLRETQPQTEFHVMGALPLNLYREEWEWGTVGFLLHRTSRSGDLTATNLGAYYGFNLGKTFAKKFGILGKLERLSIGSSLRIRQISRSDGSDGTGAGIDLGFLYDFPESAKKYRDGWSVALAIQEINTRSIASIPIYRLGAAWRNPRATVTLDFVTEEGIGRIFPGVEAPFFRKLFLLRAGFAHVPEAPRQLTLGVGVALPPLQVDVAYGMPTGGLEHSNDRFLFSLTYRFGTPFLSQYLYQERSGKVTEIENKVADLEFKKKSLEASLQDQKNLFEKVTQDIEKTQSKTSEAQKELQAMEEKQNLKKKEIEVLDLKILELENKKKGLEGMKTDPIKFNAPRKHRVMRGDTLRGLAEKYYGDPNLWNKIYEANPEKMIRGIPKEGTELIIP